MILDSGVLFCWSLLPLWVNFHIAYTSFWTNFYFQLLLFFVSNWTRMIVIMCPN